jgi:hypothetical protein
MPLLRCQRYNLYFNPHMDQIGGLFARIWLCTTHLPVSKLFVNIWKDTLDSESALKILVPPQQAAQTQKKCCYTAVARVIFELTPSLLGRQKVCMPLGAPGVISSAKTQ